MGVYRDLDDLRRVSFQQWHASVVSARDEGHTFFDWLSATDQSDDPQEPGLDVTVRLLDVRTLGQLPGVRVSARVPTGATLASVTDLFPGAAWHERETAEMFGLSFAGFVDHTDLGVRPLLLPDGFEGHPLQKSFQLVARAAKAWPGAKEPGEGPETARTGAAARRRVQAPGVPPPEWGPR